MCEKTVVGSEAARKTAGYDKPPPEPPAARLSDTPDEEQEAELDEVLVRADALRVARYAVRERVVDEVMMEIVRMRFGFPRRWPYHRGREPYGDKRAYREMGRRFGRSAAWAQTELETALGALRNAAGMASRPASYWIKIEHPWAMRALSEVRWREKRVHKLLASPGASRESAMPGGETRHLRERRVAP